MIGCRIRQTFSWLLLLGSIALAVFLGLGILNPPDAVAAIRHLEEEPGQVVYQSRQTLTDQHGNSWQTIAFKRIRPTGETSIELRLVGFPGKVAIDRTQPLTLTNSLGTTLSAADTAHNLFSQNSGSEANVGQYDLQSVLPQLQTEIPAELTLPTTSREAVYLSVSPALIEEWKSLANQEGEIQDNKMMK